MIDLLFLVLGFAPLVAGANLLVESASSLAKRLNIPSIAIGLTIISFGTSAPEFVVNVFASSYGSSQIALGNIIGSNIFNILAILGVSALIYPLSVKSNTTWIEIPLCFLSAIILLFISNDAVIDNAASSSLTRIDGIILLLFFIIFMSYNFQLMKTGTFTEDIKVRNYSIRKSVLYIVFGLVLLTIGGKIIVRYAVLLAEGIGISERIIALTVVSAGTSLPELATSAVAAYKRNVDIAIGNIVGSNIFNVFFILGVSALIKPLPLTHLTNTDLFFNILASFLLFLFVFTGKGRKLDRWEGFAFILLYSIFMVFWLF